MVSLAPLRHEDSDLRSAADAPFAAASTTPAPTAAAGDQLGPQEEDPGRPGARALPSPMEPTPDEVAEHNICHLPHRSWCRHCIAGRGRANQHRQTTERHRVPSIHADYGFLGEQTDGDQLDSKNIPYIVIKDGPPPAGTRWIDSHGLQSKGVQHPYSAAIVAQDLAESGYSAFTFKTDGEPAFLALKRAAVTELRRAGNLVTVTPEESQVGDSQSNGYIERAVWEAQAMVRVLIHRASELHGTRFEGAHPIVIWAIRYAGQLLSIFQRASDDGRAPCERRFGKTYKRKLPEFGELVMSMSVATQKHRKKLGERFFTGMYVGLVSRSDEVIVLTAGGYYKVGTVRRLPPSQRGDAKFAESCRGLPWQKQSESGEDEACPVVPFLAAAPVVPDAELPPAIIGRGPIGAHRVHIRREVELRPVAEGGFGCTDGCRGCEAARDGIPPVNHTETCRRRIEGAMAQSDAVAQRLQAAKRRRGADEAPGTQAAGEAEQSSSSSWPTQHDSAPGRNRPISTKMGRFSGSDAQAGQASSSSSGLAPREQIDEPMTTQQDDAAASGMATDSGAAAAADIGPAAADATMEVSNLVRDVNENIVKLGGTPILLCGMDAQIAVTELFGRGNFLVRAARFGLAPGTAFDMATGWDLNDESQRKAADAIIDSEAPLLLVGSPRCTAFTNLMNFGTVSAETKSALMEEALVHYGMCIDRYRKQMASKRYFVHECPHSASAWKLEAVQRLIAENGVFYVRMDQCETGQSAPLKGDDISGERGLAQATTGWITNSVCIANELARFQCRNRMGTGWHQHTHLVDGKAKHKATYTNILIDAILRGLRKQLQRDKLEHDLPGGRVGGISSINLDVGYNVDIETREFAHAPEHESVFDAVFDDITGMQLPADLVAKARGDEIRFLLEFPVYTPVSEEMTRGKHVIGTRWVDVNKGDWSAPNIRSRLCAKEYKWKNPWLEDTFAGTPPWEGTKFIISKAMTQQRGKRGEWLKKKILILDISRAHFHPECRRELFIKLPIEAGGTGYGRLLRCMYGTRDAAAEWENFHKEKLQGAGYRAGTSCTCVFASEDGESSGVVHGDDFFFEGAEERLNEMEAELRRHMIVQRKALLGPDPEDDKHATVLGRLLSYVVEAGAYRVTMEPDPRHGEIIVRELGLGGGSKAVATPTEKSLENDDDTPLHGGAATQYRSLCMRLAFMAQDAPHLQYAANKCCKHMSLPTKGGLHRLKRVARFLRGRHRCIQEFPMQHKKDGGRLDVYCDSDWAADKVDRKSVSCVAIFHGAHLIKFTVSTQGIIALSSGEAEFIASVKASSTSLGTRSLAADLGLRVTPRLHMDSTAALGIYGRRGIGKIRHLHTPLLWVQERRAAKELETQKVPGERNPADLGTKELSFTVMQKHLERCGFRFADGFHPKALRAQ